MILSFARRNFYSLLIKDNCFFFLISGPVALSTSCKLISMGLAIAGIMSITKTDLYFEMDEEDKDNKKISPQVCINK